MIIKFQGLSHALSKKPLSEEEKNSLEMCASSRVATPNDQIHYSRGKSNEIQLTLYCRFCCWSASTEDRSEVMQKNIKIL